MSIIVAEAAEGSPSITERPPTLKRKYKVWGTTDEYVAKAMVNAYVPAIQAVSSSTLYLLDISLDQESNALDVWNATASWGLSVFPVQFDTSGGTTKTTHSLLTRHTYNADGVTATPNFHGGIGYDGENMQGCDITIPQFSWTETHTFDLSQVSWDYVTTLAKLTGHTNQNSFRGFNAEEVLFMGASGGNQKNETECDIQFKFSANPNVSNLRIPGFSFSIAKNGWDYLWVYYKDSIASSFRVPKPVGCYVEKVYDTADFSQLQIDSLSAN